MAETSPLARRLEAGAQLRAYRQRVGLTAAEVARRVDMSAAKLSRIERGLRGLQINDVRALAALYELSDSDSDHLITLARASRERGWLSEFADLDDSAPLFYGLEQEAISHSNFEALRVPGLLQEEAYARALIARLGPGRDDQQGMVEARVSARIRRQAILERSERKFHFILDEAVLRRSVGSPAIMASQVGTPVGLSDIAKRDYSGHPLFCWRSLWDVWLIHCHEVRR